MTSKFLSPGDRENSWWSPTSVPEVFAQKWANNYIDGTCGIRKLNDDMTGLDPAIVHFTPQDRSNCSNIADNPIIPTLQDKLIGVQTIMTRRRAKFLAISELTSDYMDTTGVLNTIEGEYDSGNLISIVTNLYQFGFGPGNATRSTFAPPVMSEFKTAIDYKYRFSQYIRNYNDRATYYLACVLDGTCPVNFANQLTVGHT